MTYNFIFYNKEKNAPDVKMAGICNCRFAKTLLDCQEKCGRAGVCQNVEIAEDLLRDFKYKSPNIFK
jgi:hypothetical protein